MQVVRAALLLASVRFLQAAASGIADQYPHFNRSGFAIRAKAFPDAAQLAEFRRSGLMKLSGALSPDVVKALRRHLNEVLWAKERKHRPAVQLQITTPGGFALNASMLLPRAPSSLRRKTYRLPRIHELPGPSPWKRLIYDFRLIRLVTQLTGDLPRRIYSLVFERGTQQGIHDDTWYELGSERPGGMIGVWFALEDVDDENGALFYVPGSHKRPEVILNPKGTVRRQRLALPVRPDGPPALQRQAYKAVVDEVEQQPLEKRPIHVQTGDVVVWAERLLHGGLPILNKDRTRLSMVVQYVCCIP